MFIHLSIWHMDQLWWRLISTTPRNTTQYTIQTTRTNILPTSTSQVTNWIITITEPALYNWLRFNLMENGRQCARISFLSLSLSLSLLRNFFCGICGGGDDDDTEFRSHAHKLCFSNLYVYVCSTNPGLPLPTTIHHRQCGVTNVAILRK